MARRSLIGALIALALAPPAAWARDGLVLLESHEDDVGGVEVDGSYGAAVSPDGANVYVTAAEDDAVTVFRRDPTTGGLSLVEVLRDGAAGVDGLDGSWGLAVSPDGAHVYVCGTDDDSVAVFSREPSSGMLALVEVQRNGEGGVEGLDGPIRVALSADGAHLYVTATWSNSVSVFQRDPTSGSLVFLGANNVPGGLQRAFGVTISPDGANVYATGRGNNALAVFRRDLASGSLTFLEVFTQMRGLFQCMSVVVSPDGAWVYTGTEGDRSVGIFRRDPTTGRLTYEDPDVSGEVGETWSIALSPDGTYLYAAGGGARPIEVFRRDFATGRLSLLHSLPFNVGGGANFVGPTSGLAVSPDGQHVYLSGGDYDAIGQVFFMFDSAVTVYRQPIQCTTTAQNGCASSGQGSAALRRRSDPSLNRLTWRWGKGSAITLEELGDPFFTTDFALCIYDAGGAQLVMSGSPRSGICGERPCWKERGNASGFSYVDKETTSEGMKSVRLRANAVGKASIKVVGKGGNLDTPSTALVPPVVVQLQSTNGRERPCWQSTFEDPSIRRNDPGHFSAVHD